MRAAGPRERRAGNARGAGGGARAARGGGGERRSGEAGGGVRRLSVVCPLLNRGGSVCRPTGRLYIFDFPSSTRGKVAPTRAE